MPEKALLPDKSGACPKSLAKSSLEKAGDEEQHGRYSRLQHFIYAVDLNRDKTQRVMAVFTGYFDDSGSPDEGKVLVVGGYIATFWQWLKFDEEWHVALGEEGIKHFHMKGFAHSVGEFKDWKGDEPRRQRFLARLAEIISKYAKWSFAYGVLLEDYYRVDDKYMFHEHFGEPYPFCAYSCAREAEHWSETNGFGRNVFCIFEDGSKHKKEFKRLMERNNMIDPVFETKDMTPLQAADFVAWENCKAYTDIAARTFEDFRETYKRLEEVPHDWGIFREDDLERMCQAYRVPLRSLNMQVFEGRVERTRWLKRALTQKEVEDRYRSR